MACGLNDERGSCFGSETMYRLKADHFVAKCPDDAPSTGGSAHCHGECAKADHPTRNQEILDLGLAKFDELKKRRKMIEHAASGGCYKSQRDDAHGFLRVVAAVAQTHCCRADKLQPAENSVHYAWPHLVNTGGY